MLQNSADYMSACTRELREAKLRALDQLVGINRALTAGVDDDEGPDDEESAALDSLRLLIPHIFLDLKISDPE